MNENALQHWGIKGMKWGVRRYQNKDGTLTALGRKREREMNDKLKSANKELKALRAENASLKKQTTANSRRVSELSDDELRQRINRLNMEKQYADIYNQVNPTVNKSHPGKEFANKLWKESVVPSLTNVGKSAIEKGLKKAFGLEDKPDQGKALDLALKKADLLNKQITYEKTKFDLDKQKRADSNNDDTTGNKKSDNKKSDDKKSNNKTADDKATYEDPEVIFNSNGNKGNSRRSETKQRSNSDIIIDADFVDLSTPASDLKGTEIVRSGRNFIAGLLEEPK